MGSYLPEREMPDEVSSISGNYGRPG